MLKRKNYQSAFTPPHKRDLMQKLLIRKYRVIMESN